MRILLSAIIYIACVINAHADSTIVVGHSSNLAILAKKTAEGCDTTLIEHFSRYSIYSSYSLHADHYALIEQKFDVGTGCFDGYSPAKVTVSAKPLDVKTGRVDNKELWSFTTEGISGEARHFGHGGVYRVDMPGCCDAANTSKFFSLETGKLIGSSTPEQLSSDPLLEVEFRDPHDSRDRKSFFISFEDSFASSPQAPRKKAIGTIFLADKRSVIQTISIFDNKLKREAGEGWTLSGFIFDVENYRKEMSREDVSLYKNDTAKVHIKLECRCDEQPLDILVPISINGLDEKSSIITGPTGISLVGERRLSR